MSVERTEFRPISTLLTMLLLVVVGLAFLSYAMGWVTVDAEPNKTTIEIDTKEMKQSADKAVESAQDAADRVGRAASDAAKEFREEVSEGTSTQSPDADEPTGARTIAPNDVDSPATAGDPPSS
ncbi:MAG: hypothetical protein KDA61_17470 [Planctomycetales bacterium]|nr:hypothetical protein [Planctomycetales bacterium]